MLKEHKKMYKSGKSWAVATIAAVTLGGVGISQTIAHADSTENTPAQVQTNTTAEDQLTNLNNQLSANQASQAAADAKTLAAETAKINSAASAATDQENAAYSSAVASQTAANSAALADAQKNIYTPAQKAEMKNKANAAYTDDTNKLDQNHQQKLDGIKQVYNTQTKDVNNQIKQAQDAQKQSLAQATKTVDTKINDANTAVNNAQTKVNTANDNLTTAQADADKAAKALKDTQANVDSLTKASQNQVHNEIKTSDAWINEMKKTRGVWAFDENEATKHGVNYQALINESNKLADENEYQDDEAAKKIPVHLTDQGTLSKEDSIYATQYAIRLLNPLRAKLGTPLAKINKASIEIADEVVKGYQNDNWDGWTQGHDVNLLKNIANNWNTSLVAESCSGTFLGNTTVDDNGIWTENYTNLTRNDLQRGIFDSIIALLYVDKDSNFGHTTDLLATRYPDNNTDLTGSYGEIYLGVNYQYNLNDDITNFMGNQYKHIGMFHFNSESDPNSAYNQAQVKDGWIIPENQPGAKIAQPEWQENIAAPSSEEMAKILADALTKAKQTLQQDQSKAAQAKTDLTAAQDVVAKSTKTLQTAKDQLVKLEASRDKDIAAIAKSDEYDAKIKQLKGQLTDLTAKYQNDVKAENESYAKSTQELKANNDKKLAEIDQLPTNLDQLKQSQADKLAKLQKDHETKLAHIKADAQQKIADIKQQLQVADDKANQPLKDQIAQVEAQIAAKNSSTTNATDSSTNSSASNAAKSENNQYKTNDGNATIILPMKSNGTTSQQSVSQVANNGVQEINNVAYPVTTANETSQAQPQSTNNDSTLPQTGNQASMAAVLLGAMTAMFGFGLGMKRHN